MREQPLTDKAFRQKYGYAQFDPFYEARVFKHCANHKHKTQKKTNEQR